MKLVFVLVIIYLVCCGFGESKKKRNGPTVTSTNKTSLTPVGNKPINKKVLTNFVPMENIANSALRTFDLANPSKFDATDSVIKDLVNRYKSHKDWLNAILNIKNTNKLLARTLSFQLSSWSENDLKTLKNKLLKSQIDQDKLNELRDTINNFLQRIIESNQNLMKIIEVNLFNSFTDSEFIKNLPNLVKKSKPTKVQLRRATNLVKNALNAKNQENERHIRDNSTQFRKSITKFFYPAHQMEMKKKLAKMTLTEIDINFLTNKFKEANKSFEDTNTANALNNLKLSLIEWHKMQENILKRVKDDINTPAETVAAVAVN